MIDSNTLERFKRQLEDTENELRESVEGKAESAAPVQVDPSIGRLSRMDAIQSQQMARELRARQQQQLVRVRNALDSIRKGIYGQCRRCKGPISVERLEARPDTAVCVKCAEEMSQR